MAEWLKFLSQGIHRPTGSYLRPKNCHFSCCLAWHSLLREQYKDLSTQCQYTLLGCVMRDMVFFYNSYLTAYNVKIAQ